jgi:hypothetical protein
MTNKTLLAATLLVAGASLWTKPAQAQGNGGNANRRTEVGAWFGSAQPEICNVPPQAGGCPPRIVMLPEFNSDGTMVASDNGSFADGHLMGQGNWTDAGGNSGIKATFMWLQPAVGVPAPGVFRVRLLGALDRGDNDTMRGTIEPFFTPFGPDGLPVADPLVSPLPECTLLNFCLGKFKFEVKRIPTE